MRQKDLDQLQLPEGRSRHIIWDDQTRGLGASIQGSKKTWVIRYRVRGNPKQRQITLGPVVGVPLKDARRFAAEYLVAAQQGRDLDLERREEAQAKFEKRERAERTKVLTLIESYLPHAEERFAYNGFLQERSYLLKHWRPFHEYLLEDLDQGKLVRHLKLIAEQRGPIASNRARDALSRVFVHALKEAVIDKNPIANVPKVGRERARDRRLADDELLSVWQASQELGDYGVIVRLLILTGSRKAEVGGLRWSELDLERCIWTLPKERSKNKLQHQVPLSHLAMRELEAIEPRDNTDFLFGGWGKRGFTSWVTKRKLDELSGVKDWVIHDLRRTTVSGMCEIGIFPHIVEAVVNHQSGHKSGVAGVYNRAAYSEEKQVALQRWADHVDGLVDGSKPAKVYNFPKNRKGA